MQDSTYIYVCPFEIDSNMCANPVTLCQEKRPQIHMIADCEKALLLNQVADPLLPDFHKCDYPVIISILTAHVRY